MSDVRTFDEVLAEFLAEQAPYGWVSFIPGGDESTWCWFASERNAAAWVTGQSEERIGTRYEYVVRPAEASDRPGRLS